MHKDYRELLDAGFSLEFLKENVGLFEDELNKEEDFYIVKNYFTEEFLDSLGVCENKAIIYIVGCFNYVHAGHFEALILTQEYFKNRFNVESECIFVPAHDSYIVEKKGGIGRPNINERIEFLTEEICKKNLHNFHIDVVPAKQLKGEVNFCFLVDRLEKLKEIKNAKYSAFVVGSDNAGFSYAWQNRKDTYFVEVNRDGKKIESNYKKIDKYVQICNSKYPHFSSSKIRSGLLGS